MVVMSMGISLGGAAPGLVGVTLMPTYGWPVVFVVGDDPHCDRVGAALRNSRVSIKFMVLRGDHDGGGRAASCAETGSRRSSRFGQPIHSGSIGRKRRDARIAACALPKWLGACDRAGVGDLCFDLMARTIDAWLPMIVQSGGHSATQGGGLALSAWWFNWRARPWYFDRPHWAQGSGVHFCDRCSGLAFTGISAGSQNQLLVMSFLSGWAIVGTQNALNAGAGLIYPTALRANGVGGTRTRRRTGRVNQRPPDRQPS